MDRERGTQRRSSSQRAIDGQLPTQRLQAIAEADHSATSGGIGSSNSIISNRNDEILCLAVNPNINQGGSGVLDNVRERFGNHEVGSYLNLRRTSRCVELEPHRYSEIGDE